MTLRVYLAAASSDLDRVDRWAAALTAAGVVVTSSWMANVRAVGQANPRDASVDERDAWASTCLADVAASDVLWLLVPPPELSSFGAAYEAGYADALGRIVIASGDTKRTIFTARNNEYATDEEAFDVVVRWAAERRAMGGR